MLIIRVRDNEQMKEKCKKQTNKQTNKQIKTKKNKA